MGIPGKAGAVAMITGEGYTAVVPADPAEYRRLLREKQARRDDLRQRRSQGGINPGEVAELKSLERECEIFEQNL